MQLFFKIQQFCQIAYVLISITYYVKNDEWRPQFIIHISHKDASMCLLWRIDEPIIVNISKTCTSIICDVIYKNKLWLRAFAWDTCDNKKYSHTIYLISSNINDFPHPTAQKLT